MPYAYLECNSHRTTIQVPYPPEFDEVADEGIARGRDEVPAATDGHEVATAECNMCIEDGVEEPATAYVVYSS